MTRNWLLQPPSASLDAQLDHFLISCWLPAHWATRLWLAGDLPVRLERYVRMLPPHMEWRAYCDDSRTYCAVGRAAPGIACEPPGAALQVHFLDGDAHAFAGGVWAYDDGGWRLNNVLDAPPVHPAGPSRGHGAAHAERRMPVTDHTVDTMSLKVLR